MDVTPPLPRGRQVIRGYGGGGFLIAERRYAGSVLVFRERVLPWPVSGVDALSVDDFADVRRASDGVDVLLIGCGSSGAAGIADHVRARLRSDGIVVEPMDTGAACRTWNVLLTEERRAAAALIAVE